MSAELSPDTNAFLEKLVSDGRFSDRAGALEHAVDLLREEAATLEDLREGVASIDRGEGIPLEVAVEQMRTKYRIPKDV